MSDIMKFAGREEFRKWLSEHCLSNDGFCFYLAKLADRKR